MEQTKYDVFISYSRKDTEVADKICSALDKYDISYFIDRKGLSGGMEFPAVIANAILSSKIMLFLGSENSYNSKFTNTEVTFAFNEKPIGFIIPYIIDGSKLPASLKFTFSNINIMTLEEHPINTTLIKDLCQILGRPFVIKEKQRKNALVNVLDNKISLDIVDKFSFVLEKDNINNVFIGNIPVREILKEVTTSNDINSHTEHYLQTAAALATVSLLLRPIAIAAYLGSKFLKSYELPSAIESKAFDAILVELNHRYNILLEKVSDEIRKSTNIPITDFAVCLDLSKLENSPKLLMEKLKSLHL